MSQNDDAYAQHSGGGNAYAQHSIAHKKKALRKLNALNSAGKLDQNSSPMPMWKVALSVRSIAPLAPKLSI